MSYPIQPVEPKPKFVNFSQRTIDATPNLAAAAFQVPISKNDNANLTQIAGLVSKHKELMQLDHSKAYREFLRLDPGIQEQLKGLWNDPVYSKEQLAQGTSFLGKVENVGRSIVHAAVNPFETLFKGAEEYVHLIRVLPDTVGALATGGLKFSDLMNGKTWQEMWDGRSMFDKHGIDQLTNVYGHANVYIASKLLSGSSWGEIIDGYGTVDKEFETAFSQAIDKTSNFNKIMADVQSTHLDIGRELTRSMFNVKSSYGMVGSKRDAFSQDAKAYNLIAEIALDPLTYFTAGTADIVKLGLEGARAAKATEALIAMGGRSGTDFERLFAMPGVSKYWDELGGAVERLNHYRNVEKDSVKAGQVRSFIAKNFKLYDSEAKLKILIDNELFSSERALNYFGGGSGDSFTNFSSLLKGRLDNTTFWRDGAIISRQNRFVNSKLSDSVLDTFGLKKAEDVATHGVLTDAFKEIGYTGKVTKDAFEVIANSDRIGFMNRLKRMFEISPSDQKVFMTDEKAHLSVTTVYRYARLITSKTHAKALAEEFLASDMANRFILMRGIYAGIMEKTGLSHITGGTEVMEKTIGKLGAEGGFFGAQIAENVPDYFRKTVETTQLDQAGIPFVTKNEIKLDAITQDQIDKSVHDKILLNTSPIHLNQLREQISGLNINGIRTIFADAKLLASSSKIQRLRHIGGMTEKSFVHKLMKQWTFFSLAPVLGIRSTVDEFFMHMLSLPGDTLRKYIFGEGRRLGNFAAAYTGDASKLGMFKEYILRKTGSSPIEFHKIANAKAIEKAFEGAKSLDEAVEKYHNLMFEAVAARYGKNFSETQLGHLNDLFKYNPEYLDTLVNSIQDIAGLSAEKSSLLRHMIAEEQQLSKVLKEKGFSFQEEFYNVNNVKLALEHGDDVISLTHMASAIARLVDNKTTIINDLGKKVEISFQDLLFKYGTDIEGATNEALSRLGIQANADTHLLSFCDKTKAISFLSKFGDTHLLLNTINAAGAAELGGALIKEIEAKSGEVDKIFNSNSVKDLASVPDSALIAVIQKKLTDMFVDFHTVIHGAADQYNEKIINYVRNEAKGDITPDKVSSIFRNMSFDDFKELTKDHLLQGDINTNINFNGAEVKSWYAVGQDKAYENMSRTVDSAVRSPLVHIMYMDTREKFAELEKASAKQIANDQREQYVQWLQTEHNYSEVTARKMAEKKEATFQQRGIEQAAKHYTHVASDTALGKVMKYADNPNIQTNFATSVRTLGRFYRATEDFYRRMQRLTLEDGPRALYRARLLHHGLVSSGFMYTDQNGQEYITVPGDNIIFSVVDHVMRVFDKDGGLVQPSWNNLTFNLSSINPSFQQNAGAPTFAGPIAGVSALAMRSMLGLFGDKGLQSSDNLNNLVLGSFSGNLNFWNAVIPNKLTKLYTMMSGDDKALQMNSAMVQAICYLTANGMAVGKDGKTPISGESSAEDKQYFLDQVRKTTHNLLVFRQALGLFSPANPTYRQTVDIPDYLKKNGVTSLRQEFFDVMDAINKSPNMQGVDPYEQAFAMFTKKFPGMAIYTIPRQDRLTKIALRYTKEMRSWMSDNKDMYEKYGEAALIFSPQSGNLDQGAYNFLEMHGFIKSVEYKDFFDKALVADQKKQYFDLATKADEALSKTADITERSNIIQNLTDERKQLILNNPLLAVQIQPQTGNVGITDEENIYNNLRELVSNSSSNIDPVMRQKMSYAIYLVDNVLPTLKSSDIKSMGDYGSVYRLNTREKAMQEIEALCMGDPNLKQAYRLIFAPILTFYAKDARRSRGYVY